METGFDHNILLLAETLHFVDLWCYSRIEVMVVVGPNVAQPEN